MTDVYERSTTDSQAYWSGRSDPLDAFLDRLAGAGLLGKAVGAEVVVAVFGLSVGALASGLVAFFGSLAFVFALTTTALGVVGGGVILARRVLAAGALAVRRRID